MRLQLLMAFMALVLFAAPAISDTPDQRGMKVAIKTGSPTYFRYITLQRFSKANDMGKGTLIMEVCNSTLPQCVRALIGGFGNRDAKVRQAMYAELLNVTYTSTFKTFAATPAGKREVGRMQVQSEGDATAKGILNSLKQRLSALMQEIEGGGKVNLQQMIERGQYFNIAKLTPDAFQKSNNTGKSTVISDILLARNYKSASAMRVLYQAATYEQGNPSTRGFIVNEMMNALRTLNPSGGR